MGREFRGGTDMWARAISCREREGAATVAGRSWAMQRKTARLGWAGPRRGRGEKRAGRRRELGWRGEERRPAGRKSRREGKMDFVFFFQIDFQKHFQIGFEFI